MRRVVPDHHEGSATSIWTEFGWKGMMKDDEGGDSPVIKTVKYNPAKHITTFHVYLFFFIFGSILHGSIIVTSKAVPS